MAKKTAKSSKKAPKNPPAEEILLTPAQDKALKLVDKSAKTRVALEQEVGEAVSKAVRKVMKDNKIALTLAEACVLAEIWFGD